MFFSPTSQMSPFRRRFGTCELAVSEVTLVPAPVAHCPSKDLLPLRKIEDYRLAYLDGLEAELLIQLEEHMNDAVGVASPIRLKRRGDPQIVRQDGQNGTRAHGGVVPCQRDEELGVPFEETPDETRCKRLLSASIGQEGLYVKDIWL